MDDAEFDAALRGLKARQSALPVDTSALRFSAPGCPGRFNHKVNRLFRFCRVFEALSNNSNPNQDRGTIVDHVLAIPSVW